MTILPRAAVIALALGLTAASAQEGAPPDLPALREEALDLVNADRAEDGLGALDATAPLDEAAQAHAEDMLARNYYDHVSPEGGTVRDRYIEAGGGEWKLVAENIATCRGCPPPDRERVRALHRDWMESPEHRENILARGLDGFGFGIAARGDVSYAVQTFAGPGVAPEAEDGAGSEPIAAAGRTAAALEPINAARSEAGLPPLEPDAALDAVAEELVTADGGEDGGMPSPPEDLFSLLPEGERGGWRSIAVLTAACGGCGTTPARGDIARFTGQWLDGEGRSAALLDPAADRFGFALSADGQGRKTAAAVVGRR